MKCYIQIIISLFIQCICLMACFWRFFIKIHSSVFGLSHRFPSNVLVAVCLSPKVEQEVAEWVLNRPRNPHFSWRIWIFYRMMKFSLRANWFGFQIWPWDHVSKRLTRLCGFSVSLHIIPDSVIRVSTHLNSSGFMRCFLNIHHATNTFL